MQIIVAKSSIRYKIEGYEPNSKIYVLVDNKKFKRIVEVKGFGEEYLKLTGMISNYNESKFEMIKACYISMVGYLGGQIWLSNDYSLIAVTGVVISLLVSVLSTGFGIVIAVNKSKIQLLSIYRYIKEIEEKSL